MSPDFFYEERKRSFLSESFVFLENIQKLKLNGRYVIKISASLPYIFSQRYTNLYESYYR